MNGSSEVRRSLLPQDMKAHSKARQVQAILVQAGVWAQNIEAVTAQPTDISDYRYIVNENDVTIIGYLGSSKRPKVPDAIEGKPVAKIECTAFNYSDVKSAVIPEGVTAVY